MSRLLATLVCDVRLQWRNGFYWAVGFLLAAWVVVITQLPNFDWGPVLPALVLGNLSVATFFFMAGLVLLEKDEGTLEALVVTPLGGGGYLTSKVATLTALSIVENVAIVLLVYGTDLNLPALLLGIGFASVIYCLTGFIAVVRYDSINEFLFPSVLYVTVLSLPFLHYSGLWSHPVLYLHPLQPPLVLLEGAVFPLAAWQWAYGLLGSVLWAAMTFVWSRRVFRRFVVAGAGAH